MRKDAFLLLLASVGLAGCVDQRMDDALAPLDGRPVSAAIAAFGPPDKEETVDGNKVYVWVVDATGPESPTFNFNIPIHYECRVQVTADSQGTVRSATWNGNAWGCNALLARRR